MALQMTWHPRWRRARKPLGLKNLGNTCYFNSVLQCLTYTPPLAQFCLASQHSSLCKSFANQEKECPFCVLEWQISRSLSLDEPLDVPSKIQQCLTLFAEQFQCGRQEDAHEFLRYVIDACHDACLEILMGAGCASSGGKATNDTAKVGQEGSEHNTVMKEIFGGALLSEIKCLKCMVASNKTDEIMDFCLDLQSNSLKEALSRFFQPELLDGNNKYSCEKCNKLSVARKQMFLLLAPNVLVIQFKRFDGIHGRKIDKNIEFDEVLALSKFMYKSSQDTRPEYKLFGSIVHAGSSPESGHYYAYIKDGSGRWYCCNDSHVSLSCAREVLSEKVYILFYSRSNQSPMPNKNCTPHDMLKPSGISGNDSSNLKSAEVSKPTTFKKNGVSCKSRISIVLNNSKVISPPQNRQHNNSGKFEKSSVPGNIPADVSKSSGMTVQNTEWSCSLVNYHESVKPLKKQRRFKNFTQNTEDAETDCVNYHSPKNATKDYGTCGSTCEEESLNPNIVGNSALSPTGSGNLANEDGSGKTGVECVKTSSYKELAKFKEILAREASLELKSCGWVDKVQDFMRARKRICVQASGSFPDNGLIRLQLIADAKKTFFSQIPESLKELLFQRLVSYSQENSLLDA